MRHTADSFPFPRYGACRPRPTLEDALAWVRLCMQRRSQRLALSELGDHLLRDIGVSRAEARAESAKPWWR